MSDYLEKIGKLLIQAERTKNEDEKMAFFVKAQRLSTLHALDLESARAAALSSEKREEPEQKVVKIGEQGKPLNATFCELIMTIGRAQDLKFNIAHNSTYVIAFGFPSDIRFVEAMYAQVVPQMVEMADEFISRGEWKGEQTFDEKTWSYKPVHSRVARRCFYEDFTSTIGRRLREARKAVEVEITEETGDDKSLVLHNRSLETIDFYKKMSNARGSWKGSNNTYESFRGRAAGNAAGNNARLGGQAAIGGGRKAITS